MISISASESEQSRHSDSGNTMTLEQFYALVERNSSRFFRFAVARVREADRGIGWVTAEQAARDIVHNAIHELTDPGKKRYEGFDGRSIPLTWLTSVVKHHAARWREDWVAQRGVSRARAEKRHPVDDKEVWLDAPSEPRDVPCRYCSKPIGNRARVQMQHDSCLAKARKEAFSSGALGRNARRHLGPAVSLLGSEDPLRIPAIVNSWSGRW
jgi:DNA-directed RNA polymerase specialized sigma24 family protein